MPIKAFDKVQVRKIAMREMMEHSYKHSGSDPNNCAACALAQKVPNYSGWPLLYLAVGRRMHRTGFALELADAAKNNLPYFDNIRTHLEAFGHPGYTDELKV